MLWEDHVVGAVADYLKSKGWAISHISYAHQRGDDIVAVRDGSELRVEAKGEGSSKPSSSRYGKLYTSRQVESHVAVATLRALGWVSANVDKPALALPDNAHHRVRIERVRPALDRLGIGVFWVKPTDHSVVLDAPWPI